MNADGRLDASYMARSTDDRGRFASLLFPTACPRPLYDHVLFEVEECVVAPTLGSILPYWLLVVPRRPTINFRQWRDETGLDPHALVQRVLNRCSIHPQRAFWFEHGAIQGDSAISCGVDYAHLHVVVDAPFSFSEFVDAAKARARVSWRNEDTRRLYANINCEESYLLSADAQSAIVAQPVDAVGSQFFRRVIADLTGHSHGWNYRTHSYIENVRKTVLAFAQ
jgi:ATP adenylyltransferase